MYLLYFYTYLVTKKRIWPKFNFVFLNAVVRNLTMYSANLYLKTNLKMQVIYSHRKKCVCVSVCVYIYKSKQDLKCNIYLLLGESRRNVLESSIIHIYEAHMLFSDFCYFQLDTLVNVRYAIDFINCNFTVSDETC